MTAGVSVLISPVVWLGVDVDDVFVTLFMTQLEVRVVEGAGVRPRIQCRWDEPAAILSFVRWFAEDPRNYILPDWGHYAPDDRYVTVPLLPVGWLAFVLAGLLWVRGSRARRRACHCECGYDLRYNVSGRCPECGRKVPASRRP